MRFSHYEKHAEMWYTWKERIKILFTGKLKISKIGLNHVGNNLVKMVVDWKFDTNKDPELRKLDDPGPLDNPEMQTHPETEIK